MTPEQIERAAAAAWPALEVEERDGWLLRHTPGLDRARSNAALPLVAEPDVAAAEAWYAERGARALVQVGPLEAHGALDASLAAAGWEEHVRVDVLAAPAADLAVPARPVAVLQTPGARWLEAWARAEGRDDVADHAALVFSRLPAGRAGFALAPGGASVGLAILTDDGACGLFCMATRPDARRRGLAAAVLAALAEWARGAGATLAYLQVLETNVAAHALYEAAGFTRSHGYVHRRR
jgi:N-acetylglutamate synthase